MIFQLFDNEEFYAEADWQWLREVNAWVYWLRKNSDDSDAWLYRLENARAEQKNAQAKSPCIHYFKLNDHGDPICTRCLLFSVLGYRIQEDE